MDHQTNVSSVFIIVNPNAGNKKKHLFLIRKFLGIKRANNPFLDAKDLLNFIIDIFKQHGINASGQVTKAKHHAVSLTKSAVQKKVDGVVAVGGDGTINEVINGLANTNTMLGVIPLGTANVFGMAFDIPVDIEEACLRIINGKQRRMDLGRINGRYFACMVGIGFDAFIIKKADRSLKKVYGALSYIVVALFEIFRYKFYPILFTIDNGYIQKKGYFLIISNTKYYGGDQIITPQADPFSGKLEVCIFKARGILRTLWYGFKIKLGKISTSNDVEIISCTSVRVRQFGRHNIHADAEHIGKTPAKISIEKKALLIPY